jgi:hypothetical protein
VRLLVSGIVLVIWNRMSALPWLGQFQNLSFSLSSSL